MEMLSSLNPVVFWWGPFTSRGVPPVILEAFPDGTSLPEDDVRLVVDTSRRLVAEPPGLTVPAILSIIGNVPKGTVNLEGVTFEFKGINYRLGFVNDPSEEVGWYITALSPKP